MNDDDNFPKLYKNLGGENLAGINWDPCVTQCLFGTAILKGAERHVYADLTVADGNGCGSAPPEPPEFPITPGITGSWYDLTRSGEGFNLEIIGPQLEPLLAAYFYTYDDTGNQMWVTGFGPVNGATAVVPMEVTSGTVFGDDFNPEDVITEAWGTITFTFSECNIGTAEYVSTNFGSGSYDIERITTISGLKCP